VRRSALRRATGGAARRSGELLHTLAILLGACDGDELPLYGDGRPQPIDGTGPCGAALAAQRTGRDRLARARSAPTPSTRSAIVCDPRALFGVNLRRLQAWMGHQQIDSRSTADRQQIDETTIYVHSADNHRRDVPGGVVAVATDEPDQDLRILKMLDARGSHVAASGILAA
jgi:hypothetical protein